MFSRIVTTLLGCTLLLVPCLAGAADEAAPDYERDVAPLLKKYCAGCHNATDLDGDLSLETYAELMQGGANGPAVLSGQGGSSRMIRLLTGQAKPQMPPKDQPQPKPEEIKLLKEWIDAGAKGPNGVEVRPTTLNVPDLPAAKGPKGITGLAWSGETLAVARQGEVELLNASTKDSLQKITDIPGKVNGVRFSADGKWLAIAAGIPGLGGEAWLFDVAEKKVVRKFAGHRDTVYAAVLSPDNSLLATCSYDRQIILWNAQTGEQVRVLKGHNDAIYDLAFHPSGTVLASASGDQTVKLWQVSTGIRLDTLGQPLKEQFVTRFSPDGQFVLGAGVDNRIRVWKFVSATTPQINPILYARFAHEGPLVQLAFSPTGDRLVSVAEDRTIKLWETDSWNEIKLYERQPDTTPAVAWSPQGDRFIVGRLNGSLQEYPAPAVEAAGPRNTTETTVAPVVMTDAPLQQVAEVEPNTAEQPQVVTLPAVISGAIQAAEGENPADVFRFQSKAGERWVFEVNAARNQSSLDSRLEILDREGRTVPRALLQAVRDSYITFRGIDSNTRDCRLHNWEEMRLNEFVYLNGEVVKLFLAPRGPDSGFSFYPHDGSRRGFFDTSAISHAVNEPCYIVESHPVGTPLVPNGLPVFTLYYENDDDGFRQWGRDSRLNFTAPADGEYMVRISDVRGFQGEKFTYQLTARPAKPGFQVTLQGANPTLNKGSGKEFALTVERQDGFEGEIRVDISNLPAGFGVTTPLVIQAGHNIARGTINSLPDAEVPSADAAKAITVSATANVEGQDVVQSVNNFGEIKLADPPKILVQVIPTDADAPLPSTLTGSVPTPLELTIAPGQTITAKVRIERKGYDGRVQFEAINHNLPHGVIVDNIGLNGLMIVEGQTERIFFLTAADWVPETTRTFHLKSNEEGNQTSWPVLLHVRKPQQTPAAVSATTPTTATKLP